MTTEPAMTPISVPKIRRFARLEMTAGAVFVTASVTASSVESLTDCGSCIQVGMAQSVKGVIDSQEDGTSFYRRNTPLGKKVARLSARHSGLPTFCIQMSVEGLVNSGRSSALSQNAWKELREMFLWRNTKDEESLVPQERVSASKKDALKGLALYPLNLKRTELTALIHLLL